MRLWHKDLIHVLPRQQLLAQWRECCCIAKNIAEKGTPNHILVNRIMDYSLDHFNQYCSVVGWELKRRGYECKWENLLTWTNKAHPTPFISVSRNDLFKHWHNKRYFLQCFYNLEEKYDCGRISDEEWDLICDKYCEIIGS